jgi:hypothetical protein
VTVFLTLIKIPFIRTVILKMNLFVLRFFINIFIFIIKHLLTDNKTFLVSFDYLYGKFTENLVTPILNMYTGKTCDINNITVFTMTGRDFCLDTGKDIYEVLDDFMAIGEDYRAEHPHEFSYTHGFCWLNVFHEDHHAELAEKFTPFSPIITTILLFLDPNYKTNDNSFNMVFQHIRPYFTKEPDWFKFIRLLLPVIGGISINKIIYNRLPFKNKYVKFVVTIVIRLLLGGLIDMTIFNTTNLILNFISTFIFKNDLYYKIFDKILGFLKPMVSLGGIVRFLPKIVNDRTFVSIFRSIINNLDNIDQVFHYVVQMLEI